MIEEENSEELSPDKIGGKGDEDLDNIYDDRRKRV